MSLRIIEILAKTSTSQSPTIPSFVISSQAMWSRRFSHIISNSIQFVPAAFWLGTSFPARISGDSLAVLSDLRSGFISEWHTVLYSVFVKFTSLGGHFVFGVALVQTFLLCLSLRAFVNLFELNQKWKSIIVFISLASPYGGGLSTTIWKDALVGILALAFMHRLFQKILQNTSGKSDGAMFCWGTLLAASRHEMPFTLIVAAVIFGLLSMLNRRKRFLLPVSTLLISVSLAGILLGFSMSKITQARPNPTYVKSWILIGDLAFAASRNPEDDELNSFVDRYSSGISRQKAGICGSDTALFFSPGIDNERIASDSVLIAKQWVMNSKDYWKEYLLHHHCNSRSFLPIPISSGPSYYYLLHPGIDKNEFGLDSKPFGSDNFSLILDFSNFFGSFLGLVLWPGLIATLLFVLTFTVRSVDFKTICLALSVLVLARTFTLFLLIQSQDFRFASFYTIPALVVILVALANRFRPSKT